MVAGLLVTSADAAVLCKKPTGLVLARERGCKKKETPLDLAAFGGGDTLGALSCTTGAGVQWTGTDWICAAPPLPATCGTGVPLTWNGTAWVCGTGLTVTGNAELLSNATTDGRIADFPVGDPDPQTNGSYDAANKLRLPIYWVSNTGTGDLTAVCRTGDQLLSGGCVVGGNDGCYVQRSYPILSPPTGQSGWHCREVDRTNGTACANLTVLSLCLKSF